MNKLRLMLPFIYLLPKVVSDQYKEMVDDGWMAYIGEEGTGPNLFASFFRKRMFDELTEREMQELESDTVTQLLFNQSLQPVHLIGRSRTYYIQDNQSQTVSLPICATELRVIDLSHDLVSAKHNGTWLSTVFVCNGVCCDVDCCLFAWWMIPVQVFRILWIIALLCLFVYYSSAGIYVLGYCFKNWRHPEEHETQGLLAVKEALVNVDTLIGLEQLKPDDLPLRLIKDFSARRESVDIHLERTEFFKALTEAV